MKILAKVSYENCFAGKENRVEALSSTHQENYNKH